MDIGLYALRMSIETFWKSLEKRGFVKGFKGGETLYFSVTMGCLMALMRTQKSAISEGYIRALIGGLVDD